MEKIYLDNASTSFPKAPGVSTAMCEYIDTIGANVGRGGYNSAYTAAERILKCRSQLAELLGAKSPKNIIFTAGATVSLNMLLAGLLTGSDHVVTTSMEHNAVLRPLHNLSLKGVNYTTVACDSLGRINPLDIEKAITKETKAVVMTHASNVSGGVMPIEEVAPICKKHNLFFIIDSAQTAGTFPINAEKIGIDAVVFSGHKGLMGPPGIGGFLISDRLAKALSPVISGGTGSKSDSIETPDFLPDKFEAGTQNIVGIFGLCASLDFVMNQGIDKILAHELSLAKRFLDGLSTIKSLSIVGNQSLEERAAVISVNFKNIDNAQAAFHLDSKHNIMTRCGLHCAPIAHKTLGTFPHGTVRFTPGFFNTQMEIDEVLKVIEMLRF